MLNHEEVYENTTIVIKDQTVTLNGKYIPVEYNEVNDTWHSCYLPYSEYQSLLLLSKAISRESADFPNESEQ